MEALAHPSTSVVVAQVQPAEQQAPQASTSQTATVQPPNAAAAEQHLVLRLVPKKKKKKKGVQWAEDVVDNEFLGKKKSKKCCIFHKQRAFGDWSDSDSDGECEDCNRADDDGGASTEP